jgi:tol-pal system protein YbgF
VKSKPDAVLPQEETAPRQGVPAIGGAGDLEQRVQALETQLGAITSQLEQMTQQMNDTQARPSEAPAPLAPQSARGRQGAAAPETPVHASLFDTTVTPAAEGEGTSADAGASAPAPGAEALPPLNSNSPSEGSDQPQRLTATVPANNAASLYNQAYGDLLRRDYGAAQATFAELVKTYPDDALAGKAQYWLGETYYVRGEYKAAAEAFLKSYKTYKSNERAPDSLLKLAMSLAALGQKDAACSVFSEFGSKYPQAPDYLRDQAKVERRKGGC